MSVVSVIPSHYTIYLLLAVVERMEKLELRCRFLGISSVVVSVTFLHSPVAPLPYTCSWPNLTGSLLIRWRRHCWLCSLLISMQCMTNYQQEAAYRRVTRCVLGQVPTLDNTVWWDEWQGPCLCLHNWVAWGSLPWGKVVIKDDPTYVSSETTLATKVRQHWTVCNGMNYPSRDNIACRKSDMMNGVPDPLVQDILGAKWGVIVLCWWAWVFQEYCTCLLQQVVDGGHCQHGHWVGRSRSAREKALCLSSLIEGLLPLDIPVCSSLTWMA